MDLDNGILEVQHSISERNRIRDLGFVKLTPFNPQTMTEQQVQWLWENMKTQDYAFDDFHRGSAELFAQSLFDRGSIFFLVDTDRGFVVVRNLYGSDNAELHYVVWDRTMTFREIVQCGYEIVNFLFKHLKVARITAPVPDYNKNAAKFTTLLGFKFEGCLRDAILYHERHYAINLYGFIRTDWLTSTRYNNAQRN